MSLVFTQVTSSSGIGERWKHKAATDGNYIMVVGGLDDVGVLNDCWITTDGNSWTPQNVSVWSGGGRFGHGLVYADGKWILMRGTDSISYYNDLYFSTDLGLNWTQQTLSVDPSVSFWTGKAIQGAGYTVVDDMIYTLGGEYSGYGSALYKIDPSTWTVYELADLSTDPDWGSNRYDPTLTYFNNRLYLIGGAEAWTETGLREVWCSDENDFTTWSRVTDSAFTSNGISLHQTIAAQGNMYVICGAYKISYYNGYDTIWVTTNGSTYTIDSTAAFGTRFGHQCVYKDNKIWMVGGSTYSS